MDGRYFDSLARRKWRSRYAYVLVRKQLLCAKRADLNAESWSCSARHCVRAELAAHDTAKLSRKSFQPTVSIMLKGNWQ